MKTTEQLGLVTLSYTELQQVEGGLICCIPTALLQAIRNYIKSLEEAGSNK
jgi:bacteriocin-like protein